MKLETTTTATCSFPWPLKLQPAQHPSRFASGEGLVERAGRVRRQIVQDDPDPVRLGKVNVSELAHAGGEVDGGTAVSNFDLAPGSMRVEENEQVGRPIAFVLAVVALELARHGRDRLPHPPARMARAFIQI